MKALKLLIILITLSCSTFSQSLSPQIQLLGGDTVFCFGISQTREIAKHIEKGNFSDSVNFYLSQEIETLSSLVINKNEHITLLERKVENLNQVHSNSTQSIVLLEETMNSQQSVIRKKKFQIKVMGAALALVTAITLSK